MKFDLLSNAHNHSQSCTDVMFGLMFWFGLVSDVMFVMFD